MSPEKLLRTAYAVRNFRTVDMERLFIKTEMYLKSRTPHYDAGGGCGGVGGCRGNFSRCSGLVLVAVAMVS